MATLERFGPAGHDLVVLEAVRGSISVGKSPDNDLVIDADPAVSRVHATLERVGPAWCVTDLGSTNGTIVNGERVFAPRTLFDRDEIVVGRTRLVLRDPSARGDVTTAPLRSPPARTPAEQRVLVELCRPVLSGQAFTPPSSVRAVADALFVTESAVKQHLDRLYDKFAILADVGGSRRVLLANEAIQTGAVTMRDLHTPSAGPP
ncbi:MAG: FHA domain-containing protein [Ilumatobacteraceae bacterium]